jgi:molecular chaperone DnaK
MVRDAEAHAEDDRRLRQLAEARNQAEARVHEAERQLKEHGDKVDEATRRDIEGALAAARSAAEGEDTGDIEAKTASLVEALHRMSEQIYRQASQQQSTNGAGDRTEDAVEDAEYEIVDEDAPRGA